MRPMEAMPRDAAVPSTVAMTAENSARYSDTHSACRMDSLWSRLVYHLKVKPVKRAYPLLWLKLNTTIYAMGRYMKQKNRMT